MDQPVLCHSPWTSSQILHIIAVITACTIACSKQVLPYPDPHPHPKNMPFCPPQCTWISLFSVTVPRHPVKFHTLTQWSGLACSKQELRHPPTQRTQSFQPPQCTWISLFSVTVPVHTEPVQEPSAEQLTDLPAEPFSDRLVPLQRQPQLPSWVSLGDGWLLVHNLHKYYTRFAPTVSCLLFTAKMRHHHHLSTTFAPNQPTVICLCND